MEQEAFKGKVALITGSSRGIGRAIALTLARAGADIVVNHSKAGGSSQGKAEDVCAEVEKLGGRAVAIAADIASKAEVKEMFAQAAARFGRLDYLVLNAAKAHFKPIEKLLEREIRQLVDTNLIGNIFCIQQAVPLLESTSGRIVFISSLGSRFYLPSYPLVSMKAAMEAVVRDCSESLGPRGISVNAVCAGIVKTDSFRVLRMYMQDIEHIPDDLCVTPEEVADAVLFLCSGASRALRGEIVVVDKGLTSRLYRPAWTAKPQSK